MNYVMKSQSVLSITLFAYETNSSRSNLSITYSIKDEYFVHDASQKNEAH